MNKFILFIFVFLLIGCSTQPITSSLPSSLIPPRPTLPTIQTTELTCLSDAAYISLVRRELYLKHHIDQLRALLDAGD